VRCKGLLHRHASPLSGRSLVAHSWPGGSTDMFEAIVERFLAQSPLTVMARVVLERACDAAWVDAVFQEHRSRQ